MATDHLDDERLGALLHQELAPDEERAARAHVSGCARCARRLEETERDESDILSLLGAIDRAPPPITARHVVERAVQGDAEPAAGRGFTRTWSRASWQRWAATAVALLGATGAAWAIPGSPVRAWVAAVQRAIASDGDVPPTPNERRNATAPAPALPTAGISVDVEGDYTIVFTATQPSGELRIALGDAATLRVTAPSGAARFTLGERRLMVDNAGSTASFDIGVPRVPHRIVVEVAGRPVYVKEGAAVRTAAGRVASGVLVIPLAPPRDRR